MNFAIVFIVLISIFLIMTLYNYPLLLTLIYVISSSIFLRYPTILHGINKMKFKAVHISHRGGCAERIENTMAAFKNAEKCGTDMLELDCQLTLDNFVVVSHDNALNRQCGVNVKISETNYKDLPPMKENLEVEFNENKISTACTTDEEETKIVLLEEVFQTFPNLPINIDIKIDNDKLIDSVATLITKYKKQDIVVWGNLADSITKKCLKRLPNTPILFSFSQVVIYLFCYYIGLLPFLPIEESCLEVMMHSIYLKRSNLSFSQILKYKLFESLLMNKKFFRHLTDRGIQIYIWVLNSNTDFDLAFNTGCTGVMTDLPKTLATYMDDNHLAYGNANPDKLE